MKEKLKSKWLPIAVAAVLCVSIVFLQSCKSDSVAVEDISAIEYCEITMLAEMMFIFATEMEMEMNRVILTISPEGSTITFLTDSDTKTRSAENSWGPWRYSRTIVFSSQDAVGVATGLSNRGIAAELRLVPRQAGGFFVRYRMPCPEGEWPLGDFSVYAQFFPHPNDCHWFFHSEYGVVFCHECPADLHWNVELETCDYPYRAGCE